MNTFIPIYTIGLINRHLTEVTNSSCICWINPYKFNSREKPDLVRKKAVPDHWDITTTVLSSAPVSGQTAHPAGALQPEEI